MFPCSYSGYGTCPITNLYSLYSLKLVHIILVVINHRMALKGKALSFLCGDEKLKTIWQAIISSFKKRLRTYLNVDMNDGGILTNSLLTTSCQPAYPCVNGLRINILNSHTTPLSPN